jgi:hypothetical protein
MSVDVKIAPSKQKVTRRGRRRWQMWAGVEDFDNLDIIRSKHGQESLAEAARYAIAEQAKRDKT